MNLKIKIKISRVSHSFANKQLIFFVFLLLSVSLRSQVTIGSGSPPIQGALLQLKENNDLGANATKGLMLPRVHLSDKNNLYPMFEDPGNPGQPNPDYSSAPDKQEQDQIHTGLLLHNTNPCYPFGKGAFVWDGLQWVAVGKPVVEGYSTLSSLPDILYLPSGRDLRAWAPQTMSFEFSSQNAPGWSSLSAVPAYNSLEFSDQLAQVLPNNPPSWQASPAVFSVQPDIMPLSLVTKLDPWHTRQSSVTLFFDQAPCGGVITKNVLLNQTNYAISGRISTSSDNTTDENDIQGMITITDAAPDGTVKVLSNVRWQAFLDPLTQGSASGVLSGYTQTPQGTDLSDGSFSSAAFAYNGASGAPGTRFKYVKINLKDLGNRANDFVITIMQCRGNEDLSDVTQNATPAQTSSPLSDWGDKVVRHLEKNGVYEEFYSADFGVAGRWMVTNLGSVDYDSNVTPVGFTSLSESTLYSLTQGYYAYPDNSLTAYINNPYLGLLYNFTGATAGYKNALNVDEGYNPSQTLVQGVCPNGWHIPSDYEWTQLENEIITNTTKYAHVSKNMIDDGYSLVPPSDPGGTYRGKHAPAMTNACETYQGNVKGTSKGIAEGGFGAYFAGEIITQTGGVPGTPNDFGTSAAYWTGSVYYAPQAYYRVMSTGIGDAGVAAFTHGKAMYMSVRCKRN